MKLTCKKALLALLVAAIVTAIPAGIRLFREHVKEHIRYCRDPFTAGHPVVKCSDIEP